LNHSAEKSEKGCEARPADCSQVIDYPALGTRAAVSADSGDFLKGTASRTQLEMGSTRET
jgi:hypothetical protein